MEVAKMYTTKDVQDVARQYAKDLTGGFMDVALTGAVTRPHGGGDGRWEIGAIAYIWHSAEKPHRITIGVTIEDGTVTDTSYRWS